METELKRRFQRELRSTRQNTENLNDKRSELTSEKEIMFEYFGKLNMKKQVPLNLSASKSQGFLSRKRSLQFPLNIMKAYGESQFETNSNSQKTHNQIVYFKSLERQVCSDQSIAKNHQGYFLTEMDKKSKKIAQRKTQKINFINDKISKLKNINDKLNSLKEQILTQLTSQKQIRPTIPKQYYVGNLLQYTAEGEDPTVQKNSAEYTHLEKGFNILKHLQYSHHILSRPPPCSKTVQILPMSMQILPTLVLDLDETLIWTQKTDKLIVMNSIYLKDKNTGRNVRHQVHLRPFVDNFLEEASKNYEIVIFTTGTYEYTNQVIKILDSHRKYISRVVTRDHATQISDGKYELYVKDLRIFCKDLNRTVFVDNCIYSYAVQLENGIPILPFNGDPTDNMLQDLLVYLMELKDFNNIAERNDEVLKQSRFRELFSKNATVEDMINYLYKRDEMLRRNQFKCKRS